LKINRREIATINNIQEDTGKLKVPRKMGEFKSNRKPGFFGRLFNQRRRSTGIYTLAFRGSKGCSGDVSRRVFSSRKKKPGSERGFKKRQRP